MTPVDEYCQRKVYDLIGCMHLEMIRFFTRIQYGVHVVVQFYFPFFLLSYIITQKQRKIKFEPRIKLNHRI